MFSFGENVKGYDFKVLNENDARASAGIMFLFGLLSLFSVGITKSLFWAELFSLTFILEFLIRVFINPKYAPYMLLGSLIVSNQAPYWVEAKPKKFAWSLGVVLGLIMSYYIVFDLLSPARLAICVLCLLLLFSESAFGICWGCLIYARFNVPLNKCAGDVCEVKEKRGKTVQVLLLLAFLLLFMATHFLLKTYKYPTPHTKIQEQNIDHKTQESRNKEECSAPQWAIDMGHEEMWKSHHCE